MLKEIYYLNHFNYTLKLLLYPKNIISSLFNKKIEGRI